MDVGFHYRVELEDVKAKRFCVPDRVEDQRFADVLASRCCGDRIAGVRDVGASADVVRMENVETENFSVVFRNCCAALRGEKLCASFRVQCFLLRESVARFDDLVPDREHGGNVLGLVFAYLHPNHSVHFYNFD